MTIQPIAASRPAPRAPGAARHRRVRAAAATAAITALIAGGGYLATTRTGPDATRPTPTTGTEINPSAQTLRDMHESGKSAADDIPDLEETAEQFVASLAQNTALSRADAEEVAGRVEAQFNAFKDKAGQTLSGAAQTIQTGALKAADVTGKAFWGIFGALFLGLVSALVGATVGVSRRQRVQAEGAVAPSAGGLPTQREVYP